MSDTMPERTGLNAKRWAGHPGPVTLKCVVCGKQFTVSFSRSKISKCCCFRCKQSYCGKKGGAVTGEMMKAASKGLAYKKVKGRHEHRVVAEIMLGRPLACGEIVHHKNGDFLDNRECNIEVLPSQSHHVALHIKEMLEARKAKHGY